MCGLLVLLTNEITYVRVPSLRVLRAHQLHQCVRDLDVAQAFDLPALGIWLVKKQRVSGVFHKLLPTEAQRQEGADVKN